MCYFLKKILWQGVVKAGFVSLLFIYPPSALFAKEINVYLRFSTPALYNSIKAFNDFLCDKFCFSYRIEPFLDKYPLHITLYLAAYPEEHLEQIKYRVAQIASVWKSIKIKTTQVTLTPGNYIMLNLDMGKPAALKNQPLYELSSVLVKNLADLRDFKASIPAWAESIPEKKKAFIQYGSPNVFSQYSPHFSLMAKKFIDVNEEKIFRQQMGQLIQNYHFPTLTIESSVIGIGYVNSMGQITQEIANYPLNKK